MGQKTAAYNADGTLCAYYDSEISPVPDGLTNVVDITDDQWADSVNNPGTYVVLNETFQLAPPKSDAELTATAQYTQGLVVNAACAAAILSGFTSNAFGSTYSYPSAVMDQMNQNTVATCPAGGLLMCENPDSVWGLVSHTQAQALQVVADFTAWLNKCQSQLSTLTAAINSATTVADVQKQVWI